MSSNLSTTQTKKPRQNLDFLMSKQTYKPNPVPQKFRAMTIYLNDLPNLVFHLSRSLPHPNVAIRTRELLPHNFTLTQPCVMQSWAVCFCCTSPRLRLTKNSREMSLLNLLPVPFRNCSFRSVKNGNKCSDFPLPILPKSLIWLQN